MISLFFYVQAQDDTRSSGAYLELKVGITPLQFFSEKNQPSEESGILKVVTWNLTNLVAG